MTPEEFKEKLLRLREIHSGDWETLHIETDEVMQILLTQLGYGTGVNVIKASPRWYS